MRRLTESAAEELIAARAFASGPPGFVGAALDPHGPAGLADVAPARPVTGEAGREQTPSAASTRRVLRHGFLVGRADGTVTISGPPSPGLESCPARMGDDVAALPGIRPGRGAAAGIRVGLEAGLDGGGPLGLPRRWRLAHTLAPVLAAAFANSPPGNGSRRWTSRRSGATGVSATDAAGRPARRGRSPAPPGRAAGPGQGARAPRARRRRRAGRGRLEGGGRGHRHAARRPGGGRCRRGGDGSVRVREGVWEPAARDAAPARECFVAAYAALAHRGAPRELRDAVAAYMERYVMRGRCPADDRLDVGRSRSGASAAPPGS
jgi:glutamate--cysteine ligase